MNVYESRTFFAMVIFKFFGKYGCLKTCVSKTVNDLEFDQVMELILQDVCEP